ncbi:uncharacterized protein LOC134717979 [Mytilus trossulus]|uniref:uncharacterized protein LOC134717979 n=1 Tax=Mytilus trossulus TaxID=6551 RepID=UPI003007D8BA
MNKLTSNDSLHSAITEKKLKLLKILLEGGSEVNRRAYDGKTALMIICSDFGEEHDADYIIAVIQLLLKHKADPNLQDRKGRTAIMYSLRNLQPKTGVNILLKHGADPFICDNFGKNAFSFIDTENWSEYKESFSQYVEPTKQQYVLFPTTSAINEKRNDKIKACSFLQKEKKRVYSLEYHDTICRLLTRRQTDENKDTTCDNSIHDRSFDDMFSPQSAPVENENKITVKKKMLRRASHTPSYTNENIEFSSIIMEAEYGNARQKRVNSNPTASRKTDYERDRANSFKGKRQQKPKRRHSSSVEASTNDLFIFNKDEGERSSMFGKSIVTRNSDTDISLNDKNFLMHGAVRSYQKLPPIEKMTNEINRND